MIGILAFLVVASIALCFAEMHYERDYPRMQGPYAVAATLLFLVGVAVFG